MSFAVFIHGRWGYEGKDDETASGSYALHTRTWRSTCFAPLNVKTTLSVKTLYTKGRFLH